MGEKNDFKIGNSFWYYYSVGVQLSGGPLHSQLKAVLNLTPGSIPDRRETDSLRGTQIDQ